MHAHLLDVRIASKRSVTVCSASPDECTHSATILGPRVGFLDSVI